MDAIRRVLVAAAALAAALHPQISNAQSARSPVDLKAPAPRLPNGKPDFSGTWARPGVPDMTRTTTNANGTSNKGEPNPLPFTPWGQAQWDNYNPVKNGDYAGSCLPFGWIRSFTPHPMQIVQNTEYITFLFEQSTMYQVVNTEGLPHRKDYPPTWFGDSRGRWDGDTLVIEAVNFNGYAKLGTIGHPMSNRARLTMFFRRPDMGHIEFTWVLDDPKTYTRPIRNERVFVLTPNVEVMEYACVEGTLSSLLERSITPWLGPTDQDTSNVPAKWEWTSYDLTRSERLTGVVREVRWEEPLASLKLDVSGRTVDVTLAPPVRMEFRNLEPQDLKVGTTVTFAAVPHKQTRNEYRGQTVTVGRNEIDLR
jgi:hypothetical protein